MEPKSIKKDGKLDKEFGRHNAEISRELAADRHRYIDMNNLAKNKKNK